MHWNVKKLQYSTSACICKKEHKEPHCFYHNLKELFEFKQIQLIDDIFNLRTTDRSNKKIWKPLDAKIAKRCFC